MGAEAMSDIVQRLRAYPNDAHGPTLRADAADEIERLRAEKADLKRKQVHAKAYWDAVAEMDRLAEIVVRQERLLRRIEDRFGIDIEDEVRFLKEPKP
jgi:hypothetical protein